MKTKINKIAEEFGLNIYNGSIDADWDYYYSLTGIISRYGLVEIALYKHIDRPHIVKITAENECNEFVIKVAEFLK